jgi:hypothetical protein
MIRIAITAAAYDAIVAAIPISLTAEERSNGKFSTRARLRPAGVRGRELEGVRHRQ